MTTPLRVFTFSPAWGLPTGGPFGLKLEAGLRMLGVPYERVFEDNHRKGPKRKSPWIEDGDVRMGDTELIFEHVMRTRGVSFAPLEPRVAAQAHVLRHMLEEHFHQVFEYEYLLHPGSFEAFRSLVDRVVPRAVSGVVTRILRASWRKHLFERGVARHAPAEIEAMGRADIDALVQLLGDQPWLFGDAPCKVDASAFGLLAMAIKAPIETPVCAYARAQPSLVAYVERGLGQWFSDP